MELRDKFNLIKAFSSALSPIQQRWAATEREAHGMITAFKKFDKYSVLKPFYVIGDHNPLTAIFNTQHNTPNEKLLR